VIVTSKINRGAHYARLFCGPRAGVLLHHQQSIYRAYELLVDVQLCKFETTSLDERRFRFRAVDCEAITDKLGLVDWHVFFSRKGVDL
jgi:hypothetical protein